MVIAEKAEYLLDATIANYMHEELVALLKMANDSKFEHLAYLLDMAAVETDRRRPEVKR